MVGWMDDEALHRTLTTGRTTFWSRSRQEYWVKGETSGHRQWVQRGPARLRRRHPAGQGRPGGARLPHRRPHLLRRHRAAALRWLSATRSIPSARPCWSGWPAPALAAVAGRRDLGAPPRTLGRGRRRRRRRPARRRRRWRSPSALVVARRLGRGPGAARPAPGGWSPWSARSPPPGWSSPPWSRCRPRPGRRGAGRARPGRHRGRVGTSLTAGTSCAPSGRCSRCGLRGGGGRRAAVAGDGQPVRRTGRPGRRSRRPSRTCGGPWTRDTTRPPEPALEHLSW